MQRTGPHHEPRRRCLAPIAGTDRCPHLPDDPSEGVKGKLAGTDPPIAVANGYAERLIGSIRGGLYRSPPCALPSFHNRSFCESLVLLALTLEPHIASFAAMHHYGRSRM